MNKIKPTINYFPGLSVISHLVPESHAFALVSDGLHGLFLSFCLSTVESC